MVSFSKTGGAHCDSVTSQSSVPAKTVQMGVKIPVQQSNFDALQKGALMGASVFMEHIKNHIYQYIYKSKSIPSPGTKFISTDLHGGPFFFVFSARYHHPTPVKLNQTQLNSTRIKSLARVQMRV